MDTVTNTYYARNDSNGKARPWYSSSHFMHEDTGYRISLYYADGLLFFADAAEPGQRSAVTFYFWGEELIALHDLEAGYTEISYPGSWNYEQNLARFGEFYKDRLLYGK